MNEIVVRSYNSSWFNLQLWRRRMSVNQVVGSIAQAAGDAEDQPPQVYGGQKLPALVQKLISSFTRDESREVDRSVSKTFYSDQGERDQDFLECLTHLQKDSRHRSCPDEISEDERLNHHQAKYRDYECNYGYEETAMDFSIACDRHKEYVQTAINQGMLTEDQSKRFSPQSEGFLTQNRATMLEAADVIESNYNLAALLQNMGIRSELGFNIQQIYDWFSQEENQKQCASYNYLVLSDAFNLEYEKVVPTRIPEEIKYFTALKWLSIMFPIEDLDSVIKHCPLLEKIGVYQGEISLDVFARLPNLKEITCLPKDIEDEDIRVLVKSCPGCSSLSLRGNNMITNESLNRLSKLTSLNHLCISGTQITDFRPLLKCVSLEGLELSQSQYDQIPQDVLDKFLRNGVRLILQEG